MPDGTVTVAVLTRLPVAPADTVPVSVNVAVPPLRRSTVVPMLPLPEGAPHALPADATHVHAGVVIAAGTASVTVAPITALGPLLLATIVYVTGLPGV